MSACPNTLHFGRACTHFWAKRFTGFLASLLWWFLGNLRILGKIKPRSLRKANLPLPGLRYTVQENTRVFKYGRVRSELHGQARPHSLRI